MIGEREIIISIRQATEIQFRFNGTSQSGTPAFQPQKDICPGVAKDKSTSPLSFR
jgi:hypothetical protein